MPLSTQEADPKPYQPRYIIFDIEECEKMYLEMRETLEKMKKNFEKINYDLFPTKQEFVDYYRKYCGRAKQLREFKKSISFAKEKKAKQ